MTPAPAAPAPVALSTSSCCRNVVAVVDGDETAWRAVVLRAVSIAAANHGRITLIAGIPQTHYWNGCALAVMPAVSRGHLAEEMQHVLCRASALVPADVPLVTVLGYGHPRRVLRRVLEARPTDLVIVGERLARTQRARRRLTCSVSVEVVARQAAREEVTV